MKKKHIFLAANSPSGFVSFFDRLYNPYENVKAYIIKGGPGTGKSSFMRKVALACEERGHEVIYVHCSSDPHSLDAIQIPELNLIFADGTPPHVLEPRFPGAVESIINLGSFWNEKKLSASADKIRTLTLEGSIYHRRSSRFLNAAGQVHEESQKLLEPYILEEKLRSFAVRFCTREAPKKRTDQPGKKDELLLSGITPNGTVFFSETVKAYAGRVIAIEDEFSSAAGMLLEHIGETAVKNGNDTIFCKCPMKPKSSCEHLIFPSLSLAIVTAKKAHPLTFEPDRTIHIKRFLSDNALILHKNRLALNHELCNELIEGSVEMLKSAKQVHDALEKIYIDAMDFEKLDKFAKQFIFSLFAE